MFQTPKNTCQFIGNVGKDPEMRYTPGGQATLRLSLAVSERWKGDDGEYKEKTHWVPLTAWRKTAELLNDRCQKGTKLLVVGKYETSEYEKDGEKKYGHSFVVQSFEVLAKGKDRSSDDQDTGDGGDFDETQFPF
jgi:single-strand DNA-binding protein